ncbi:hypothetical protein Bhyg_04769 [Pseudolycoriella hygida]|uniref:F-box domain-containing protein n=1 Tax=Pseudolycoriella hygida TaxID=35572 RepID=A0A9Q0NFW5_9DIPT|nr:hypothetical protein Bhyg_04769 [Pseudolycoriella hygida]
MAAHQPDLTVLGLNDDCLLSIFNYLSLMDLATTSEVCERFKLIADDVFSRRYKHIEFPKMGAEFSYNHHILKHFGHKITSSSFSQNEFHLSLSKKQMSCIFEWLGKYCTETLEKFSIDSKVKLALPPTALTFFPKVKHIDFFYPISSEDLKAALVSCKNLVTLRLDWYDGPFHFANHIMPHLKEFETVIRVNRLTEFDKIVTFFKNHTQLTALCTEFFNNRQAHYAVDLSFLSHLSNLTKLRLILNGSNVSDTASLSHLNHLQEFTVDCSYGKETDVEILEHLGSVESLADLGLGMPDVSHILRGIERFKNLFKLEIFDDDFNDILSLGELRSNCIELEVWCTMLAQPNSLVNVVSNLKKLERIKLRCQVALSEKVCADLVKVCSSQDLLSKNLTKTMEDL